MSSNTSLLNRQSGPVLLAFDSKIHHVYKIWSMSSHSLANHTSPHVTSTPCLFKLTAKISFGLFPIYKYSDKLFLTSMAMTRLPTGLWKFISVYRVSSHGTESHSTCTCCSCALIRAWLPHDQISNWWSFVPYKYYLVNLVIFKGWGPILHFF